MTEPVVRQGELAPVQAGHVFGLDLSLADLVDVEEELARLSARGRVRGLGRGPRASTSRDERGGAHRHQRSLDRLRVHWVLLGFRSW